MAGDTESPFTVSFPSFSRYSAGGGRFWHTFIPRQCSEMYCSSEIAEPSRSSNRSSYLKILRTLPTETRIRTTRSAGAPKLESIRCRNIIPLPVSTAPTTLSVSWVQLSSRAWSVSHGHALLPDAQPQAEQLCAQLTRIHLYHEQPLGLIVSLVPGVRAPLLRLGLLAIHLDPRFPRAAFTT
jgi:hypothetical protein